MVDSAIPEIITLALDDKSKDIWEPAMRLLITLSSLTKSESHNQSRTSGVSSNEESTQVEGPDANSVAKATYEFFLSQINPHLTKLMKSLESEDWLRRALVVELLSSVSSRDTGRRFSQLVA